MRKIKTNKSAYKRFSKTKTGKLVRGAAYGSHLATKKPRKRVRKFKKTYLVSKADTKLIKRLLPNL